MREFDLVVLASGINAKPIMISGVRYIPPRTQTMSQAELYAGTDKVKSSLGKYGACRSYTPFQDYFWQPGA